jgi:hypothetical protein
LLKDDICVFQQFEKSFHIARSDECVYLPHSKDASERYHVFNNAVLAPRDSQFKMFCACLLLLKKAEGKRAIILAPCHAICFLAVGMIPTRCEFEKMPATG